jgi:hypothetical protein
MALTIPPELLKAAAERKLVLFVGAGMSQMAQPQLPGWQRLLEMILERGRRAFLVSDADAKSLQDVIARNALVAAGALRKVFGDEVFYDSLRAIFREDGARPAAAHALLPEVRFSAILTTNFDDLIEQAFPPSTPVYVQVDHAELAAASREQSFCIVKIHGDLDRPESIVLGREDYRQMMFGNEPFRIFLTTVFTTKTVVFVGYSLTDPDLLRFLEQLKFQMEGHLGGHFALMRTEGMNPWERKDFEESYGIQVFGDDERANYADIPAFLAELKGVAPAPAGGIAPPSRPRQSPPLPAHLVHRKREEDEVKALLLREEGLEEGVLRIVAIHGMPGAGKSTLAAAVANDETITGRFPDGVLWAELKPDPDLVAVLNGWLRELGDSFESSSVEALSGRWRSFLSEKAVLLVLDNVWNAEDVRACLAGGARSRVLITTRRADVADEVGAELYELGTLTGEESLELLSRRLGQSFGEGQRSDVLEVAEATGYLPQALELAAARVKRGTTWSELKSGLRHEVARLEKLEAPRRTAGPMRLEAAFNLSVNALRKDNERAWRSFCWLGIIAEDAVLAAPSAATLFDVDESEAESLLEILWNDALLSRGPRMLIAGVNRLTYRVHNLLHALARELLCGEAPGGLGYRLAEAHGKLIERIFAKAGIQPGQPVALALPDDGYSHAHLVWHLEQAGNIEAIHALFRESSPRGKNAWLEARQRLGQMPGFREDLSRAWRLAEVQTARELVEGKAAHSAALELRYALMTVSLKASLWNVPSKLMLRLVEAGIWTATEALGFARQVGESSLAEVAGPLGASLPESELLELSRIEWGSGQELTQAVKVIALAEHLPKEILVQRLEEVLEHADSLRDEARRLVPVFFGGEYSGQFQELAPEGVAIGLAAHLPGQDKDRIREALLAKARAHPKYLIRTLMLAELVPYLDEPARTEAMREALEDLSTHRDELRQDSLEMVRAFTGSPVFLDLVQQQLSVEGAVAPGMISDEVKRFSIEQFAEKVRAYLEGEQYLGQAVDTHVAALLTQLVPHLPASLLPRALQLAWSLQDESVRFLRVAQVLTRLPEPERSVETGKAFESACALEDPEEDSFQAPRRFRALAALAPCFDEIHWRSLLADLRTTNISSRRDLLEILASLLPYIPQEMLADLESLEPSTPDESYSLSYGFSGNVSWMFNAPTDAEELEVWLAKLPRAGEAARRELVGRALRLIEAFPVDVGKTLERMGPWLTEAELRDVLRLMGGWNPVVRTEALNAIAQHLPASLLLETLDVTGAILDLVAASEALYELSVTLVENDALMHGLAAAEAMPDLFLRTAAFVQIARAFGGPERLRIVDLALDSSEKVPEGEYRYRGNGPMECRSVAIAMAGLLLDEPARGERLRKALEAGESEEEGHRPAVLARLSGILAEAGHVDQGFEIALRISWEDMRCSALVSIAPSLDEAGRDRVLAEVSAHPEPEARARFLAWLAAYLSPVQAGRVLKLAGELEMPADRILVIAALLPSMVEKDREGHIAACLRECREMPDDAQRAGAFSALVSRLNGEHLLEARDIARSGPDEQWRNTMQSAVAVQLAKVGRVEEALDEVAALSQEGWRAEALRQMAGFLTGEGPVKRALEIAATAPYGSLSRADVTWVGGGKNTVQIDWSAQAAAVGAMAPRVPDRLKADLYDLFRQILQRLAGRGRGEFLISLDPLNAVIRRLAEDRASAAVSEAVIDAVRWWPP